MATFTITQALASRDLYLIPNAVGCHTDLTPIGETNNWECIDDPIATPDNDDTYNYNDSPSLKYDLYSLPNHTTEAGVINYVQVFSKAKSQTFSQHEDGIYKIIITDDACGNIYKSNDINLLASTWRTYSNVWTTNPRTATAWTWDNVDNLQIGSECSSPTLLNQTANMILYPNGDGVQCGAIRPLNSYDDDPTHNWMTQAVTPPLSDYSVWITAVPWLIETWYCDHYLMDNHTALGTEPINYVYVRILVRARLTTGGYKVKTLLVAGGTDYHGDEVEVTGTWTHVTTLYTDNPDTVTSWTWADIDSVLCGFGMYLGDIDYTMECTRTELIVNYDVDVNPEIRTTQNYVKINYVPSDVTCTLTKPEGVSVDHNMNMKMLNFWDGSREVYSLSRSNKTMVLTGSEYQTDTCNQACPCERITCIRNMGGHGETIVISGLSFTLFNGNFKIRSFGWKHISEKPEYYEWILELEYDD